jgi:DNA-binding transcriptional LysR family regulator
MHLLSNLDMNLLVALDALLATESVKLASERLALSPSATSHALNRLRELLDDPLLVRAGQRLVATPRAVALKPQVAAAVRAAEAVFRPADEGVDPAALDRRFDLHCTDHAELTLVCPLSARLSSLAPSVQLQTSPVAADSIDRARRGDVDLGIGVYNAPPDDFLVQDLCRTEFVCVVRDGHPVLKSGLTLDAYAELHHVLVSPRGGRLGVVDRELAARGRSRRIARWCASFLLAHHLVVDTDYVLTVSASVAEEIAPGLGLVRVPPPLPLAGFTMQAIWHRRHQHDAEHQWLVEQLIDVANS